MTKDFTNQEILTKAITRAISGGFVGDGEPFMDDINTVEEVIYYFDDDYGNLDVNRLIWRHDFVRALWGERLTRYYEGRWQDAEDSDYFRSDRGALIMPKYQYHLQQMVIADDPIKYLGEHLND